MGASMRGESSFPGPIDYYTYMNFASVAVQLSVPAITDFSSLLVLVLPFLS
ncbi:hypothetical protein OIU76_000539 [Salix suchowensis]|nr:hypothetical protein OIU76_000539 [Salix suchowensis]